MNSNICTCNDPKCPATKINYPALRVVRKLARMEYPTDVIVRNIWNKFNIRKRLMFNMLHVASHIQENRYLAAHIQFIEVPEAVMAHFFGPAAKETASVTLH